MAKFDCRLLSDAIASWTMSDVLVAERLIRPYAVSSSHGRLGCEGTRRKVIVFSHRACSLHSLEQLVLKQDASMWESSMKIAKIARSSRLMLSRNLRVLRLVRVNIFLARHKRFLWWDVCRTSPSQSRLFNHNLHRGLEEGNIGFGSHFETQVAVRRKHMTVTKVGELPTVRLWASYRFCMSIKRSLHVSKLIPTLLLSGPFPTLPCTAQNRCLASKSYGRCGIQMANTTEYIRWDECHNHSPCLQ